MDAPGAYRFGAYLLDLANQCLLRGDEAVALAPKPFAVLRYLASNPGRLVTKDELLDAVWPDTYVGDAVLKVAIGKVRRALGDDGPEPAVITTVSRKGYRFVPAVVSEADGAPADGAAPRFALAPAATVKLPFVGRDEALVKLDACRQRALAGERQIVFVTGEAGIGKSTLIDTWVGRLADPAMLVGRGQCLDQFGVSEAYLPVLEALGGLARGAAGKAIVDGLRRVAPSWLVQMPWLVDDDGRVALQRELEGATRERMLRELAELGETLAQDRLLVLVLEDLHWSDPSTIDLIAFLAQRRERARLLVIGSYRPVDAVLAEHAIRDVKHRLEARRLCSEIPLSHLGEGDIERYAELRLGGAPPRNLAAILHQRSSCSPLFVASVVEHLLERDLLIENDGAWRLAAQPGEVAREVPEGLRGMIERQIEMLAPGDLALLEAASVAGVEFSAAVAAAGAAIARDAAEDQCERLAQHGQLIRAAGTASSGDGTLSGRYTFQHALHRNVLYQRTSPLRRRRLHKRLALWLEASGANPGELAHHFLIAGLPEDLAHATRYAQRAAERARAVFAYDEAARHHATALRAAELRGYVGDAERCLLLLEHAEALERAAAIERAEESFRRAVELARTLDDPALFARAVLGFGSRYGRLRADPQLVAALEEALERVGTKPSAVRARILSRLDYSLSPSPGTSARRAHLRAEALRIARRVDDPATQLWVARCSRWGFRGPQTKRELAAGLRDLDALLERLPHPEDHMSVRLLRVTDLFELGDSAGVDAELAALEAEVARTPIAWFAWFVLRYGAMRALATGDLGAAQRIVKEAVALGDATEHPHVRPVYLLQSFVLRRLRGDDVVPDIAPLAAANVPAWQPLLVHARSIGGQLEDARRGLDALARDEFGAIPENGLWLVWLSFLSQTCRVLFARAHAAVLARLLEPYADRVFGVGSGALSLGHGGRYLGLLATTLGRGEDAARHFARALVANERMGALPWLALTQVDYARTLAGARTREARARGKALADAGRATATNLGMAALAQEAATLARS